MHNYFVTLVLASGFLVLLWAGAVFVNNVARGVTKLETLGYDLSHWDTLCHVSSYT